VIERGAAARIGAVIVIAGLALSGCGGSDDGSSDQDDSKATAAGVSLTPPQGWGVQNNRERGLVLAPEPADDPAGPRFTARPATGDPPEPRALVRSLSSSRGARAYTVPSRVRIDGHQGVAIAVRKGRGRRAVIMGLVAVPLGPGRAYTFLLEAPAREWEVSKAALNRILFSAEFDVAAVPQA
jgi:hypothetical protein